MAPTRASRVVTVLPANLEALPLTPEDFFVLSRVDGRATEEQVIAASGMERRAALAILRKLVDLGAVRVADPEGERDASSASRVVSVGASSSALRTSARDRRLRTLRAQMAKARPTKPAVGPTTVHDGRVHSEPVSPTTAASPAAASAPSTSEVTSGAFSSTADEGYPLASDTDPRLETHCALPRDTQRRVLALTDALGRIDPFALLGIAPIDERKAVQRAYHAASREFHPDRYFGRSLGGFAPRVTTLFEAISAAYESLLDDSRRRSLVAAAAAREAAKDRTRSRGDVETPLAADPNARIQRAREQFSRGEIERQNGRPGAAASLFRLAMELDSQSSEYEAAWRAALDEARRTRAAKSFAAAERHVQIGQTAEAAHFYLDAAEADPTARYLAEAAAAVSPSDTARARELAMRALDVMAKTSKTNPLTTAERGRVHLCSAIAFLSGGQVHTARQQAQLASTLIADDPQLGALLKSGKLT